MFDWNDEELTNIIWGDYDEGDDHIVPYQYASEDYHNKKEWSQDAAINKATERRTTRAKGDFHGRKLESISKFHADKEISPSGLAVESWPKLSSSKAAKTDKDSFGSEVSNNLAEITKYISTNGAGIAELDKDSEKFQNPQEGKEQVDFVDYSWANIGSFDDLDRILSNDEPIFGNVSLDSADELWSSSEDVTNSPVKSFPLATDSSSLALGALSNPSGHLEIKKEDEQPDGPLFTLGYMKMNDPASDALQNAHIILDHVEYPGGKSNPTVKEQTDLVTGGKVPESNSCLAVEIVATPNDFANKAGRQKKLMKYKKKLEEKSESKLLLDSYGVWTPSGQYLNQLASSVAQNSSSSVPNQQRQLQGSETLQYQHIADPLVSPSAYENLTSTYSMMPVLSHIQSREFKHQSLLSGYEVSPEISNPVNKSEKAPTNSLAMTPQEKIEKLRRRQQMQAMLAIKKQQQKLGHQVTCSDHSVAENCPREYQIQHVEGAVPDGEDSSALPSRDPYSPLEQDDSNTISVAIDDYSVEETIMYQLQDIISKLDIRIRLCIRDSLFRLAQSAMQRHYARDSSSTNISTMDEEKVVAKEENDSCNRYFKILDMETDTNPTDRTVAHLLFHRPLDLPRRSVGTPESPTATKIPFEHKKGCSVDLKMGCMPESPKICKKNSHQGSKSPCPFGEPHLTDQFKYSPNIETPENASNYGPADGGAFEVEASH
ncbi:hypothetical protein CFOL_v3_22483 [Cephalotus follicularis]|uniref:Protein LNK2 n=1 Tax=Cephalotus follicularis TaxID=3775 RepID=A0A1Q3CFX9_CEPFO|nr:hypothetical protein CFOL_v3_22483 [Cephalotus follicularis]